LTMVYLPPEVILKEGGLNNILKEEKISHLTVEELDYSQLLKGKGGEIENVWPYLLQDAVQQENFQNIIRFADNFESFLRDTDTEDLVENDEIKVNINKLFTQLKGREEDRLHKCSKDLLKSVIKSNSMSQKIESDNTQLLFKDLSNDDFASVLWEEISMDDNFNPLNFQIFSYLTEKRDQKSISNSLEKISQEQRPICRSPRIRKRIKELLTGSSDAVISECYQSTLASILNDISYEGELTFDHYLLQGNYRFLLLYLLNKEKDTERAVHILEEILGEWESIVDQRDLEFVKCLVAVLDRKRSDLSYDSIFMKVNKLILYFVAEYNVLEDDIPSYFDEITHYLRETFLGIKAFIDKMFKANKVSPMILQLFFQIYIESFSLFKKSLMKKSSDMDFLEEITKNLAKVDSPASLESLKCIFSLGNDPIKIKALESIEKLYIQDEDFLFDILKKRGMTLKKKALQILMRNEETENRAIEELFSILSPFGIKNMILLENVKIAEEMELKGARDKLAALSEWNSLWNKKLKGEAVKVLKEWDARTN
ncbi:MAG: hypothetical protein OEY25_14865, partial [Candidatus Aminicenantes bacterium]|nr:hypothetical protein [Candidatus Aminicenantes bacterium]